MDHFLADLLASVALLLGEIVLVVGLGAGPSEAEYDVVLVIKAFGLLGEVGRVFGVLLLELGLVGVLGHAGLVAADGEVAPSIANGVGDPHRVALVLMDVLGNLFLFCIPAEVPSNPKGK